MQIHYEIWIRNNQTDSPRGYHFERVHDFWREITINFEDTIVIKEGEYYRVKARRLILEDSVVELYCEEFDFDSRDYDRKK